MSSRDARSNAARRQRPSRRLAPAALAVVLGLLATGCGLERSQAASVAVAAAAEAAPVVACPAVPDLGAVPAQAIAEVERELAVLDNQIAEADARLASSQGQGGPDFVRNAILGPLQDKRTAVLDRIEIAIRRAGGTPPDLSGLAPCALS